MIRSPHGSQSALETRKSSKIYLSLHLGCSNDTTPKSTCLYLQPSLSPESQIRESPRWVKSSSGFAWLLEQSPRGPAGLFTAAPSARSLGPRSAPVGSPSALGLLLPFTRTVSLISQVETQGALSVPSPSPAPAWARSLCHVLSSRPGSLLPSRPSPLPASLFTSPPPTACGCGTRRFVSVLSLPGNPGPIRLTCGGQGAGRLRAAAGSCPVTFPALPSLRELTMRRIMPFFQVRFLTALIKSKESHRLREQVEIGWLGGDRVGRMNSV